MTEKTAGSDKSRESSAKSANRVGFYAAILTASTTLITFAFAMTAIPISGANCLKDCIEYPYLDTISQFPKDYLWMYLASLLIVAYVILMASIHAHAPQEKKIFSQIGLTFAIIAAVILLVDYFIQFTVVPVSLMNGETEGITLMTQYNPHGIFIALEEAGYLMMSVSFLFAALAFIRKSRLESAVRWIFILSFVLVIVALMITSILYGLERQDHFEVVVISVNWLVLIVNGVLLSRVFRRALRGEDD
jgi:hypothetical protein